MPRQQDDIAKKLGISDIISDVSDEWAGKPYRSGFTGKVVLGALFIAILMLPGLIYMGLVVGANIGSGAEWVAMLLFLELARRTYRKLERQELIIINHMASSLTGMAGGIMLSGGVFASLIWHQYLKRSDVFRDFNLTDRMPAWFAPPIEILADRTFLVQAWLPAIVVSILSLILYKMQFFGLGYLIFRVTSDVEKLPFPLARIGAEGATALAESEDADGSGSWRWSVFSVMAVIGSVWGLIYMGIPSLSETLFGTRIMLIPIPFLDLTPHTEQFLPSAAMAIGFNAGLLLSAFVIPWRAVVGGTVACLLANIVLPPILFKAGIHKQWQFGYSALDTQIANSLDLWMSIGIGAALSVACTSLWLMLRSAGRKARNDSARALNWSALWNPPKERQDLPLWVCLLLFAIAGTGFVMLVHGIVNLGWLGGFAKPRDEWFPLWILCVFAFIWTPMNSYIHARLAGVAGQHVSIPFVREGSFFLSGYKHSDIWMAPIPLHDFGGASTLFKQLDLTRVTFSSLVKVELLTLVLLTAAGFFYWSYLWGLGPVPSETFPYAQEMWPYFAKNAALWASALGEGNNYVMSAIRLPVIGGAAVGFIMLFALFNITGIPLAFYYGAIGGIGQFPYVAITMAAGLGLRVIVARRIGADKLRRYAPVMMAGFSAGFGIVGMLIVAVVLIKAAISGMLY